jgi:hypothetical protein
MEMSFLISATPFWIKAALRGTCISAGLEQE